MKMELRNIKLAKCSSADTPAYTATLYFGGKKIVEVKNDGRGDCDCWFGRLSDDEALSILAPAIASLPVVKGCEELSLRDRLELWCHTQIWDQEMVKALRRHLKKKIIGIMPDNEEQHFDVSPSRLDEARPILAQKYPGITILNDLDDQALLATYKRSQGTAD